MQSTQDGEPENIIVLKYSNALRVGFNIFLPPQFKIKGAFAVFLII